MHIRVAGIFQIGARKVFRLLQVAVIIEVHRQKSHLGRRVAESEALVELDAVKNNNLIGNADMFQVQVAVAVPDFMFCNSFFQKVFAYG